MSKNSRARVLSVMAAGLTVTALLAATTTPASAAPTPPIPSPSVAKLKHAEGTAASRVIPGRYLVETVATPLSRGGSRIANESTARSTTAAAKTAGAKVDTTYSDLWSGVSVTATDAQIKVIAESPSVKAVYPVLRVPLPKTTRSATKVSSALAQISALGIGQNGTGIKVGVIDSGIDYNNPDLGGSGTNGNNADFGLNAPRVKYGYDFVGDAYNPDSSDPARWSPHADGLPDDCDGHGTHVAGIIGAKGSSDGESTTGVAPGATLGAYRIFGCEGGTDTAIILKAISKAKTDKMNVVNLSIGSDFDSWPSYPDAVAVANLAKAGVVVAVAAGNSGNTGLFSAGSPAVGAGVISVASYETATVRSKAISIAGNKVPYTQVTGAAEPPADNSSTLKLELASNGTACTPPATVSHETALLVQYGSCSQQGDVHQQVANAAAAGAAAVVVYYAGDPDLVTFGDSSHSTIPAIGISGAQGAALAGGLRISGQLPFTWLSLQSDATNPVGGKLSTFSSAGLAADLSLVPTITAPGGKIYSTLPLEQGGHGNLSGTSMAAPFVAGTAAVMLQAKSNLRGHPADLAKLLYNTATPVMSNTELGTAKPEGVFRQGSGLVDVTSALAAKVTASPSTIKLGEGTSRTVTISLTNKTSGKLTYAVARVSGVSAAASSTGSKEVGTTTPLYAFADVGFKASKTVTVKAGKTVKVKVKITAPAAILKGKPGMLYGGWVTFKTTGAGNTVSVPFVGLRGDYQAVKVLNKFKFNDGTDLWSLPSLAYKGTYPDPYLHPQTSSGRVYTMANGDVPSVVYHLDYPASDVMLKITNTKSKKSYDAILDWSTFKQSSYKISSKSIHLGTESRDASAQSLDFMAIYKSGKAWAVPDGTYTLTLKVLKPLGSSKKKSHWETFTTKSFVIHDQN